MNLSVVDAAGRMGGEYLDSLGKTDLKTLTKEEWRMFIYCVGKEYFLREKERIWSLENDDEIPF